MSIDVSEFGAGTRLFQLKAHGLKLAVTDYGAGLVSLVHPDGTDVVLGLENGESYRADTQFMGVIAGRYANRISGSAFFLDGNTWRLPCNDGKNHIHGGSGGFGERIWRSIIDEARNAVRFSLSSQHLDNGYPGRIEVAVTYRIAEDGDLQLTLEARADRTSLVNLAPHGYFDIAGNRQSGRHMLQLYASRYTPVNEELIPTGDILPVDDTAYDFCHPRRFDQSLDINYVTDGSPGKLRPVGDVWDPVSGRKLSVRATAPGVQVYGGANLGAGGKYPSYAGFCLEPQYFPDSPNQTQFAAPVIDPEHPYHEIVEYSLGAVIS